MELNQFVRTAQKFTHDNQPAILSAIGVVGSLSTAYLAGKASYTAAQVIAREEEYLHRTQDPLDLKAKSQLVWKLYIPAAASGAITITAIVFASRINSNRTAAIAAAYSVSERAFAEYKTKVVEQIGERKEQAVRDEIAQDRVRDNPPSEGMLVISDGKVLCFENYTGRYFHSDMESLRRAVNNINHQIMNEMYVTMNDWYYELGLPPTKVSGEIGWDSDTGLLEMQYSSVLSEDGKPAISFDYNYVKPI